MRLLHLVHQYPPDYIGGVELNTQQLAREQARRGHDVAVFYRRSAVGSGLERWDEQGVQLWAAHAGIVAPTGRFLATFHDPSLVALFEQMLDAVRPEVVHVQHLMGLPAALVECLIARNIPYLVTLHDYWWGCANAQLLTNDSETVCDGPEGWINCGRCALARAGVSQLWAAPALAPLFAYRQHRLAALLDGASCVIAPTHFTLGMYRRMGFPLKGAMVLPHGIVPPNVPGLSLLDRHGRESLRVAYVGGVAQQKGVHVLVEAMNHLPEGAHLSIFGDLDAFPDYVAFLRRLVTHPHIRFEGRVPNETLLPTLAGYDLLVVPSIWYETAALVIQEAFAVGVPVIVSGLGALRERVRDGVDGLLVPPGDPLALAAALRRFLDEPMLLQRLQQGIRPVRTIAEQVNDLEALYRAALR